MRKSLIATKWSRAKLYTNNKTKFNKQFYTSFQLLIEKKKPNLNFYKFNTVKILIVSCVEDENSDARAAACCVLKILILHPLIVCLKYSVMSPQFYFVISLNLQTPTQLVCHVCKINEKSAINCLLLIYHRVFENRRPLNVYMSFRWGVDVAVYVKC